MEELKGLVFLCIIGGLIYYFITKKNRQTAELNENLRINVLKISREIIQKNLQQLARQKQKSTFTDDYGKENLSRWHDKEIPYFVEHHIYPKLNQIELANIYLYLNDIFVEIEKSVKKVKLKSTGYDPKMSGFEFEDFCVQILEKEGWKVEKTKAGADQGVDLIIRKPNIVIGVQCKKYSKPIGNKAVQEIKAGISHYNLDNGIVLSNNKFTKSATELAITNRIDLIHYLDIKRIKGSSQC
ncbi:MAG: restriction endonuclease [Gelidibacter sp.]